MATRGRTWNIDLDVVGLKFRGWKRSGRNVLAGMCQKGSITGLTFEREPDHPKDSNAIMVMLPQRLLNGKQLGYLRRDTAELLAPKLDAGTLKVKSVTLLDLDAELDWNVGTLHVIFEDVVPKPSKQAKSAKITKPA